MKSHLLLYDAPGSRHPFGAAGGCSRSSPATTKPTNGFHVRHASVFLRLNEDQDEVEYGGGHLTPGFLCNGLSDGGEWKR